VRHGGYGHNRDSRGRVGPGTALALAVLLPQAALAASARTFDQDLAFLESHVEVVRLEDARSGARVLVVPAWQGRVMTSAPGGKGARGYGWLNDELIAFGGEDRLWLGPEGGQFSIFFKAGDPFDLEHWQTPPLFDTEAWAVTERDAAHVTCARRGRLVNYSRAGFDVALERTVSLLGPEEVARSLGGELPDGVRVVAFASRNTLTNRGTGTWTRDTGLLSLWVLGMFQPGPRTTVVVPHRRGPEDRLGPLVNDSYFGKVPKDRLVFGDGVLFFKGDGRHRAKIGLSPRRAEAVLGSWDEERHVLTVVTFDRPPDATSYVNSMWEIQKDPFGGDVVNSYNDGPPAPGERPLGPFYELETSSPAAALSPGRSLTHVHRTFHLEGPEAGLDAVARRVLGVGLRQIETALPPSP
jgi:hypothetical protein